MVNFLRSSPSLLRTLVLPFVLLVLLLSLTIGVLSYRAGSKALDQVADKLLLETVARIGQAVDRHISGSAAVLEAAFPNGMPAPDDISGGMDELRTRFWIATSLHSDSNKLVYYGNREGQVISLLREAPNSGELRVKLSPTEHRRYFHLSGITSPLQPFAIEQAYFDPRTRPWFLAGEKIKTTRHTWTAVYIDFTTHELVATRAHSVLSNDGQFQGVVATDVSLKELNDFVSNLKISPHGLAFIIEPDGALIASSAGPNIAVNQQRQAERLNASQDQASMVAITYAQLKRRLDPAAPARSGPVGFTFESPHGEPVRAAYEWIRDDAGLEWLTVVAMPERDYLSGVQGNAVLTLFVSLFAVSLTLLIGWLLVQRVVLDIRRLSEAAERIGRGLPPMVIDVERRDEVGHLARSFQLMQSELSVDRLTGLTSREALLRHLNSGIRRYQGSSQAPAFAVLFVDLNRFKSINDNYGHAVGDLALAEVAERLSSAVREGDVVARYGGDEFVMVLWRVGEHSVVQRISDKIHDELERPLACLEPIPAARGTAIGASIGVAFYPGDGVTADALIQFADRGMYAEKQAGRQEGAI